MNILITCAGRRAYLVDYFREVVGPMGGCVVTANSELYAAGLLVGDRQYVVPKISEPEYLPTLLKIVVEEKISLVLSVFDIDLPVLAAARDQFRAVGAEVAVSDPETIEIAFDKWRMFQFFTENCIPTPKTWLDPDQALCAIDSGEISFPLLVKPRWGMGSIAVYRADTPTELRTKTEWVRKEIKRTYLNLIASSHPSEAVLIQEFISGTEYGADVFNDLRGNHLSTAVKQKISSHAGSTDFAVTVQEPALSKLCMLLSKILRHRSNLDVDIIWSNYGQPYVIEINARFGGGYPFSHLAGARFPNALVQLVLGQEPETGEIEPGVQGMMTILPKRFRVDGKPHTNKSNSK